MPNATVKRLTRLGAVLVFLSLLSGQVLGESSRPLEVGVETDFLPYAGTDAEGRPTGFAVELFQAVARAMGLTANFRHGTWDQMWQELIAGRIDALPLVANMEERAGLVEFTRPHTFGYDSFFTRKEKSPIDFVEQARPLNVIVLRSDASHHHLAGRGFGAKLVLVDDLADGFRLLASGQQDALLAPLLQGNFLSKQLGLTPLLRPGPLIPEYRREFCFATRRGETGLRDRLDEGLSLVKANGEYDRLYRKWLGIHETPQFPLEDVLWGAAMAAGLVFGLALWNWQLRRKVAQRTAELARSAEEVRQERQRLHDVLNALPVYVVLLSKDYQVPFANRFFENRYGSSRGRPCHEYLFNRDSPCEVCNTFDVLKTGQKVEWAWTGPDGRDYEIHDFPFADTDGSPMILEVGIDVTEANKARQALREANLLLERRVAERTADLEQARREAELANDLLRTTMDNSPALMSYVDATTRYRRVNQVYQKWFGLTQEQVVGRTMREIVGEEVWPQMEEHVDRALAGERQDFELRIADDRDGPRWVHATYSPDRDGEGNVRGFVVHVLDISPAKRAELRLRESEERFRIMADTAPVLIWMSDADKQCTWVNQQWLAFTGRTLRQEQGFGWAESVHVEDMRHCLETFHRGFEERIPFQMEYRLRRADGAFRWVSDRAVPRYAADGKFLGYIGACADISDAKEADLALQRERKFLRQVIDASPNLIFVKDRQGRFLLANRALADTYGTDVREVLGKTDADFNRNADEVAHFLRDDLDAMDTHAIKQIPEETVCSPDGRFRWFSTTKVPLLEDDGSCQKVLGMATDITGRKQMEEALRDADRRKDEFLAMLAHELRNPLAPISNAVQALQLSDAHAPWCIEVIGRQLAHLTRLVDDLLDVSRISRGLIALKKERLAVADVLEWAMETSRPLLEARSHRLTLGPPPAGLYVEGDRVRLTQVVSNLLNNAAKYTDPGGEILLAAETEQEQVRIRIRDNGRGIDAETLAHLFDLFYQGERNIDRAEGGMGIGLWLAHSLVAMHGGEISAFSEGRGKGTELVVSLPRAPEVRDEPVPPLAAEPGRERRLSILVVDDNPDVAHSTALLLEIRGHDVRIAHDGPTALAMARQQRPQVAILDIGLPGMDGLALARSFREDPELKKTRLVAFSGYGRDADLELGTDAGFDRYLTKPAAVSDLLAVLEET